LAIATGLLLVYAVPLFVPPPAASPAIPPDAWLLARLFPGVSWVWVAIRLLALFGAVWLLSAVAPTREGAMARAPRMPAPSRRRVVRILAVCVSLAHLASALWAARWGPLGQSAYVLLLFVPPLLLGLPAAIRALQRSPRWIWRATPVFALCVIWFASHAMRDLDSPRLANMTDAWVAFYAMAKFAGSTANILTDLYFVAYPRVGALPMLFHGLPLAQAGLLPLSFSTVQALQFFWLAATGLGVGLLAHWLAGRGAALIAAAVFLFSPFTEGVALFPSPLLVATLYSTAIALCALGACRWRSEAALAALGAFAGLGTTYPSVLPVLGFWGAVTLWNLRRDWRATFVGWIVALCAFLAVVTPALANVFAMDDRVSSVYGKLYGITEIQEPVFMGQMSLSMVAVSQQLIVRKPLDTIVAALLAPFAHPRMPIKLWGDVLFDPIGASLLGIGIAASLRAVRRSWSSPLMLLFFLAALSPAFISPYDRVDIGHAVALPVPAAVLAAAGFKVLGRAFGWARAYLLPSIVFAVAIGIGGTAVFDVVNPRILRDSALGIMFRSFEPSDSSRVLVLNYEPAFDQEVFWLFTGPITAFAGEKPIGYFEYGGGELPVREFVADGMDLLFWSPGVDADLKMTDVVCRHAPDATLYEMSDRARLGSVLAARVSSRPWTPRLAPEQWRSWTCPNGTTG
jgi:hypothetical protein